MKKTLVLNADYYPLTSISWKKAMELIFKNKAIEVEFYEDDHILDASGNHWPRPCVIRLKKYIKRQIKKVPFCRKNVYMRDRFQCQYCGKSFEPNDLTYDHVIPRSKWKNLKSPTNWDNIVTACFKCNNIKADRTCEQSKMYPINNPKEPKYGIMMLGFSPWDKFPEQWKQYLQILPNFKEIYDKKKEY